MTLYEVLYQKYSHAKGELLGVLPERRNDLRGQGRIESATKWAKSTFGGLVGDEKAIVVVVKEYE